VAARLPSLSRAVSSSIRDAKIEPWGSGAVALAKRYAALIDQAQALAEALGDVKPEDESTAKLLAALRAKVDAQQVASDLGPKLLQALDRLGLTPMARTGPVKTTPKGGGNAKSTNPVDALAALRDRRHGTAS
jgi:hypothetical protein